MVVSATNRYNNGKFYNGLIAVAYELNAVQPGDGGFACVPGSHKANFELPPDWKNSATQDEIPEVVDCVAVGAGDAIIFTEALAHGTVPLEGTERTAYDLLQVHSARRGLEPVLLQR